MVAAEGKLDRFDGEENQRYFEDIRKHMAKVFSGWDYHANTDDYLQSDSPNLKKDFDKKFPFAIQRFGQLTWCQREKEEHERIQRGQVKRVNTPARTTQNPNHVGGLIAADAKRQPRVDPKRTEEELRVTKVSLILFKYIKMSYFSLIIGLKC